MVELLCQNIEGKKNVFLYIYFMFLGSTFPSVTSTSGSNCHFVIAVGESSGRASRSIAKHIPGPSANLDQLKSQAGTASSAISKAHLMAQERGEKLSQLEERTERMMNEAENFQSSAHGLMLKYKDKKWYQLWIIC